MVCLRNISVDTLHKEDTEDDDDDNDDDDDGVDDDDDDNNNNNNNVLYGGVCGDPCIPIISAARCYIYQHNVVFPGGYLFK
jgi:hypothetical protein